MSEYIARDKLLKIINENVAQTPNERCAQILEAILNAPTADVVEVVRCKDCQYSFVNRKGELCCNILESSLDWVEPTGYCCLGERKEDGI